jgi:hypothetical protein
MRAWPISNAGRYNYESGVRHTEEHFIEDIAHLVAVMNTEFEKYFY